MTVEEERMRNQDAWKRMVEWNRAHGFPHQEWELRKIHKKWRSLGRLASQPASLRDAEYHN